MFGKENLMKKHLCTACKTNCMDREPLLPKCEFYTDTTLQPSPKCKKCGRPTPEYAIKDSKVLEYDPCIGMLLGVISACCGHGSREGHLIFENGTKLIFDGKSLKVGKTNKPQSLINMPNKTSNRKVKKQETFIEWLDGEIETVVKYRKDILKKEKEAGIAGDFLLEDEFNKAAYGMEQRVQAFKDVKGREMSKETERCSKEQVVEEFINERCLHVMSVALKYTRTIFESFKKECEHRNGAGCTHPDYHKDFALANMCRLEDCPIVMDKCNDM